MTDVTIVGGGYLGLWTAIRIQERSPSLKIAVVDTGLCGAGASGRNGGFVTSYWAKYLSLHKLCGTHDATRIAKSSAEAVLEIGAFCRENGIDAEFRADGVALDCDLRSANRLLERPHRWASQT
ncbi:FAD-dependent oxidoreductase [Bradyrhizobium sp. JR3.5]